MTMEAHTAFNDIEWKVRSTIAETLRLPIEHVKLDARLDEEQLALDSLRMIKLNVALEETFDIALSDLTSPEHENIRFVRDVVEIVAAKVQKSAKETLQ